jgi:hypothetical protein
MEVNSRCRFAHLAQPLRLAGVGKWMTRQTANASDLSRWRPHWECRPRRERQHLWLTKADRDEGAHKGRHHHIDLSLVAEVEGQKARLSANAAVAAAMEEEPSRKPERRSPTIAAELIGLRGMVVPLNSSQDASPVRRGERLEGASKSMLSGAWSRYSARVFKCAFLRNERETRVAPDQRRAGPRPER